MRRYGWFATCVVLFAVLSGCGESTEPSERLGVVDQAAAADHFVTEWTGTQVTVKINPSAAFTYKYDVDWDGDGTFDDLDNAGDATHTYATNGPHTVRIRGAFPAIRMNDTDCNGLKKVVQWGTIPWESFQLAFNNCTALSVVATDAPNLTGVTNTSYAFGKVAMIGPAIGLWNMTNVEDMSGMFFGVTTFNENIGNWNTGNATNMYGLFNGASSFNQDISGWDTSKVTIMTNMFNNASSFNQPLNAWNTSVVTTMSNMFAGATAFDQPLDGWSTDAVTNMSNMFNSAAAFNQPLNGWNTGSVTDMSSMFAGATVFNQPLNSWDMGKVATTRQMFWRARAFDQDISSWFIDSNADISNVKEMFRQASAFNKPLNLWKLSNATTIEGMFQDATSFNQPVGMWATSNVSNMSAAFLRASNFDQPLDGWDIANVTDMSNMLDGTATSDANYDATLMGWAGLVNLQTGVTVGAAGLEFCAGASARQSLINNFSWNFQGDVANCCGNNIIDGIFGEICDDGPNNGNPGSCSLDCMTYITECYMDLDGDGFGSVFSAPVLQQNPQPNTCLGGYSQNKLDCDDGTGPLDCGANCYPGNMSADICDGFDQNCDLVVDEDFSPSVTSCGQGACTRSGTTTCVGGVLGASCTSGTPAANDATCNNVDDDCDGSVDEDYVQTATSCGQGVCASSGIRSCENGIEEDSCATGTPTGSDANCNGLDENCNGTADENYTSTQSACGIGACAAVGTLSCSAGTETNSCTSGTPAANDMTCDGIDDDCDGQVDEDFVGAATSCGVGACADTGTTSCVGGAEQDSCTVGTPATDDATCDGVDDDCDGTADEDYIDVPSTCGVGACSANGVIECVGGAPVDTCAAGTPAANDMTCDGVDDDCNGQVDEDYSKTPTACGQGVCRSGGELSCVGGSEVNSCVPGTPAADDATCDGFDDDCDGDVDEDYVETATNCGGQGACEGTGTLSCVSGSEIDSCTGGEPSPTDATCDGIDDNCNGSFDEDYSGGVSTCGVGACRSSGTLTCVSGGVIDSCTPGTPAADDATCDGIDDDCDGEIDEDYVESATSCGVGACSAAGTLSCVGGAAQDSCVAGTAPSTTDATCDGVDDDCDGSADEDYFEVITSCGVGACGASGIRTCSAGSESDSCSPGTAAANDATCDGVDDDCDGDVDEDYVSTATACGLGACERAGTLSCVLGAEQNSCAPGTPSANDATCNLIDDDCDGDVDEDATACFACSEPTDCPTLGNDCKEYTCPAGVCVLGDKSSLAACDDGTFCTDVDTCDGAGSCSGSGSPCSGGTPYCREATTDCVECRTSADCPASSNECQVRACTAGVCGFTDKPLNTSCSSDNNACNGLEQCLNDQGSIQCLATGVNPCDQSGNNPVCVDGGNDTNTCAGSCGDGKIGVGETCDRGGLNTSDANAGGCSTSCELNPGWRCPGGATTCANPEPICGDGIVIGSREICDAGAANGTTECGCTATCTFVAQGTNCDDSLYCNGVDTCNGAGVCSQHSGSPCSLGDAACREDFDACDECLSSVHCDNGLACDGMETCDIALGLCADGPDITCTGDFVCDDADGSCGCPSGQAETGPNTCDAIQCTLDADCDDNNVCNGVEACNTDTSQCVVGTPLTCENGLTCDGRETCDPTNGCEVGNPVICSSSFECAEPAGTCTSKCGNGTLDTGEACDDGVANSNTTPDACRANCQLARCGDGVQDAGEQCDDGNQQVGDGCSANCMNEECATVADCDAVGDCQTSACTDGSCFYNDRSQGTACTGDGLFCTGTERCDGAGACVSSGTPCGNPSAPLCDEGLASCLECVVAADCDDGVFCNGAEVCDGTGACEAGAPVECDSGFTCDALADTCITLCGNGICDTVETVISCPGDCGSGGPDRDGDGVSDAKEIQLGTDPDLMDSDGDSVPDGIEIGDVSNPLDTDSDSLIDALDEDDDGDGIPTRLEDVDDDGDVFDEDDDGDSIPNFRDSDDDGDGVPTLIEAFGTKPASVVRKAIPEGLLDSDEDGVPNYLDKDDDNDTILTADEVQGGGNAWQLDTDRDGVPNYVDNDDDGDTLLTADEVAEPSGPDFDNDGRPNYLDNDDDGDDVLTADEVNIYFSKPYDSDSDDDNLLDGEEVKLGTSLIDDDTDDDGLLDGEEITFGADPLKADTDDDGLLDGDEIKVHQTGVRNPDTDDDGLLDGDEVFKYLTDPNNRDSDNDGFSDGEEVEFGSDPNSDVSVPIPSDAAGGSGAGGCTSAGSSPWTPGFAILGLVGLGFVTRKRRR